MKRDPEKTLKGQLNLAKEQLEYLQESNNALRIKSDKHFKESEAKDEYISNYKRRMQFQLDWYRNHIQALVSKISGGGR